MPQLREAVSQTGEQAQDSVQELSGEKAELKSAYRRQVAKTIGWMAGTAAALVIGGLLPNPVSVLAVAALSAATIRSITKARNAQKALAAQLPHLESGIRAGKQVLADTVAYGPHLLAWENTLSGSAAQRDPMAA